MKSASCDAILCFYWLQLSKAQSESKMIVDYRNMIRRSREQFHKELESLLPDVKIAPEILGYYMEYIVLIISWT